MFRESIKIAVFIIFLMSAFWSDTVLASKKITLASAERAPYIGEDLPNNGFIHELVTHVFEHAGYQVEINFYPLARSRYLVKLGRVDGMMPSTLDLSLAENVVYSDPFFGGNMGLLKKKSLSSLPAITPNNSLSELFKTLEKYSIGIVRGTSISPDFDQQSTFTKQFVPKDIANIDLLHAGRVDVIAIDKYTAAALMVNHRPHLIGELEFISPLITHTEFHVAFSKKSDDYLQRQADFNKSLAAIKSDGTLARLLNKYGFFMPKKTVEGKVNLTIGTVSNKDMLLMQELSTQFESLHPHISLTWKVFDENTLRKRLLSDLAIADGQFDIMTIGLYETLIWAKHGWLHPLSNLPESYDIEDIFPVLRDKLSFEDKLYAAPFYSESSITYYRKDLFEREGIHMPKHPIYQDIKEYASILHKPYEGTYGVCLRAKPGWGENIALFTTMVNTHNGGWFDKDWRPTLNSSAWLEALTLYKKLLTDYGPPNPTLKGYNENKQLFLNGQCAIWIDATVAAGEVFDPKRSVVANKVALVDAPTAKTKEGSKWLWTWALAITESSKNKKAATEFITWATSKDYIEMVAEKESWLTIPSRYKKVDLPT